VYILQPPFDLFDEQFWITFFRFQISFFSLLSKQIKAGVANGKQSVTKIGFFKQFVCLKYFV